jgi:hypothetical protein
MTRGYVGARALRAIPLVLTRITPARGYLRSLRVGITLVTRSNLARSYFRQFKGAAVSSARFLSKAPSHFIFALRAVAALAARLTPARSYFRSLRPQVVTFARLVRTSIGARSLRGTLLATARTTSVRSYGRSLRAVTRVSAAFTTPSRFHTFVSSFRASLTGFGARIVRGYAGSRTMKGAAMIQARLQTQLTPILPAQLQRFIADMSTRLHMTPKQPSHRKI